MRYCDYFLVLGLGLLIFLGFGLGVSAMGEKKEAKSESPSVASSSTAAESAAKGPAAAFDQEDSPKIPKIVDEQALEDLKKIRATLAEREKELSVKEAELLAREKAMNEQLKKLEEIREDLIKMSGVKKQESQEQVNKLIETLETMSPKSAAQLMSGLDDSLAITAMSKMATPKLAKIMNSMDPKRSAKLSELMAGVVRAREALAPSGVKKPAASGGAAETTTPTGEKGGTKKDEHTNNNSSVDQQQSGESQSPVFERRAYGIT